MIKEQQVPKIAYFWVRILIRIINFLPFFLFFLIISFIFKYDDIKNISQNQYYFFLIIFSFMFVFFNFILPILTKGYTIGNIVTRTKIHFNSKNYILCLFKKEFFISFSFVIISTLFALLIDKNFFIKIVNKQTNSLSFKENLYLGIISAWTSCSLVIQMFIVINLIVKKEHNWIDQWSQTQIIYLKKYNIIKIKENFELKPVFVKNNKVEWIEE